MLTSLQSDRERCHDRPSASHRGRRVVA